MKFYEELDRIMKQDFGNRGLIPSLPANPAEQAVNSLARAKRAILLTGFPVRLEDGQFIGETDGPSGTINLAAALTRMGCAVRVMTDAASYGLLHAAISHRAPMASLSLLPSVGTDVFIRKLVRDFKPTHFVSLERPGKAADGHYYNMRGEIIDDMLADSASFLKEARNAGAETISIGDGGNEMGMGYYTNAIVKHVPSGELICTEDSADIVLASGVSNWWAWGIAAALSLSTGLSLLPTEEEEAELLLRVVNAGGVDGCTKKRELTVDNLSLELHLDILRQTAALAV